MVISSTERRSCLEEKHNRRRRRSRRVQGAGEGRGGEGDPFESWQGITVLSPPQPAAGRATGSGWRQQTESGNNICQAFLFHKPVSVRMHTSTRAHTHVYDVLLRNDIKFRIISNRLAELIISRWGIFPVTEIGVCVCVHVCVCVSVGVFVKAVDV